jgi:O-antigen/teichoic acid export membrane protein
LIKRNSPKSEFSRNVLTLMTGTTIAQAIPIALMPLLTRMYTPEDFGMFALFIAVTTTIAAVAGARYESAIMLPSKDEDAINIASLSLILITVVSLVTLMSVSLFNKEISNMLDNEDIGFWLYFSPLSIFMIGVLNNLNYLNVRKMLYKDIAKANIYKSVGMTTVQLLVGLIKSGVTGLIGGQIFAHLVSNYRLAINAKNNYEMKFSWLGIVKVAKRYKNFPMYATPSTFINTSSLQAPILLLSYLFSQTITGYFSIVMRIISLPVSLLGNSIGQVLFQSISHKCNVEKHSEIASDVEGALRKLVFIGIIPFSFLVVFADLLFGVVLGEMWYQAGVYAQFLSVWGFFLFIHSPLTPLFDVFEKQRQALFFTTSLFLARIIFMLLAYSLYQNALYVVVAYSIAGVIFNLVILFYLLKISAIRPYLLIVKIMFSFVLVVSVFYALRYWIDI